MKKWVLFLIFFLFLHVGYKFTPILAQENKDSTEIKKIINAFYEAHINRDINSAMQWVSPNSTDFRSTYENFLKNTSKKYIDLSIGEIEIIKLDIQDNIATGELEYNWKQFNLDTIETESGRTKRAFCLVKENGSWKITRLVSIHNLPTKKWTQ